MCISIVVHIGLPQQESGLENDISVSRISHMTITKGKTLDLTFMHLSAVIYLVIWVFTSLSTHCTGHITTGSFMGRGTSTYSWSRFCTVNCQPMASIYQLSHLRSGWESNSDLRGGRRECYHSATVAPLSALRLTQVCTTKLF